MEKTTTLKNAIQKIKAKVPCILEESDEVAQIYYYLNCLLSPQDNKGLDVYGINASHGGKTPQKIPADHFSVSKMTTSLKSPDYDAVYSESNAVLYTNLVVNTSELDGLIAVYVREVGVPS